MSIKTLIVVPAFRVIPRLERGELTGCPHRLGHEPVTILHERTGGLMGPCLGRANGKCDVSVPMKAVVMPRAP